MMGGELDVMISLADSSTSYFKLNLIPYSCGRAVIVESRKDEI
jgi:hypothetical protein